MKIIASVYGVILTNISHRSIINSRSFGLSFVFIVIFEHCDWACQAMIHYILSMSSLVLNKNCAPKCRAYNKVPLRVPTLP